MRIIMPAPSGQDLPLLVTPETLVADSSGALKEGDPRLEATCQAASRAVRRYCRWHVAPVIEETMILDGSGGRVLQLRSMEVRDVSEVKVLGRVLDDSEFAWSADGLIEGEHPFPRRYRSIEVTLQHGFEEVPDLMAVASQIARFALASPMGRTREQAGQIAVSWGTAEGMRWSESTLEMMNAYRIQPLP